MAKQYSRYQAILLYLNKLKKLRNLASLHNIQLRTILGISFVDLIYSHLSIDPSQGIQILSPSLGLGNSASLNTNLATIVAQFGQSHSPTGEETNVSIVASRLKKWYPGSHKVSIIWTDGIPNYKTQNLCVCLSDLEKSYKPEMVFSSLYIPPFNQQHNSDFWL